MTGSRCSAFFLSVVLLFGASTSAVGSATHGLPVAIGNVRAAAPPDRDPAIAELNRTRTRLKEAVQHAIAPYLNSIRSLDDAAREFREGGDQEGEIRSEQGANELREVIKAIKLERDEVEDLIRDVRAIYDALPEADRTEARDAILGPPRNRRPRERAAGKKVAELRELVRDWERDLRALEREVRLRGR